MKQQFFKQLMLLICLVAAGAQSAQAQRTPDFTVNGVGYSYSYTGSYPNYHYNAAIMSYTGTAETLTIPDSVINGSTKYKVTTVGGYYKYNGSYSTDDTTVTFSSVKTLIFEGKISVRPSRFICPKLTEIHFKGGAPYLSGSGSDYFANGRISSITAYVAGKTQAECDEMKRTMAVWSDFKDVKPLAAPDEKVNVHVTAVRAFALVKFEDNDNDYVSDGETKTFSVGKYSDFSIVVLNENSGYGFSRMTVNGKDVTSSLQWPEGRSRSSDYVISEISSDIYITLDGNASNNFAELNAYGSEGGKIIITNKSDNTSVTVENGNKHKDIRKNAEFELTIAPNDGYELDKVVLDGMCDLMNTESSVSQLLPTKQNDGTYKMTGTYNMYSDYLDVSNLSFAVVFKPRAYPKWNIFQTGTVRQAELVLTPMGGAAESSMPLPDYATTYTFDGIDALNRATLRLPAVGNATHGTLVLTAVSPNANGQKLIPLLQKLTGVSVKDLQTAFLRLDLGKTFKIGRYDMATAQKHKTELERYGATVRIDQGGSDQITVIRNGEDITSTGEIVDGLLTYRTFATSLKDATWVIITDKSEMEKFDTNGDGTIDMKDARAIKEKYLNQ